MEFAICVSLLATLAFGTFEFGWAWKQRVSLQAITRSSGRIASNLGNAPFTDREALRTIIEASSALPGGVSRIRSVVIYKATCTTCTAPYGRPAQVDPLCDPATSIPPNPPTSGVAGKCNVYFPSGGYFTTAVMSSATTWGTGTTTSLDYRWNPTTRVTSTGGTGPDWVGIRINYTHRMIVGMFGSTIAMSDDMVFRNEPT